MVNFEVIFIEVNINWLNVVKIIVYLKNMDDFVIVNNVYVKYFDFENVFVCVCVEVVCLFKDVFVEIDCIVVI